MKTKASHFSFRPFSGNIYFTPISIAQLLSKELINVLFDSIFKKTSVACNVPLANQNASDVFIIYLLYLCFCSLQLYCAKWLGKSYIMCGGSEENMARIIDRGTLNVSNKATKFLPNSRRISSKGDQKILLGSKL
jgi:hypothetical protein